MDNLYTWCGTAACVHVLINKFYGKDGVCSALLGRLMTNIRYAFRAWDVNIRVCVRDSYLFKINFCMHLAGNRSSTIAKLEAEDGFSVMTEGQGK